MRGPLVRAATVSKRLRSDAVEPFPQRCGSVDRIWRSVKAFCRIVGWFVAVGGTSAPADEAYELQRAHSDLFRRAAARVSPCVVRIDTVGGAQPSDAAPLATESPSEDGTPPPENVFRDDLGSAFLVADGPTTGVIWDSEGWILSSSFNFVRDPTHITVRLADERRFVAKLVARDKVRKVALLKIEASDLPTPVWVPQSDMKVGQWAIALGYGYGGNEPAITVGIVSATQRMLGNAIQTDVNLSPVNYGGPLIDLQGQLLGICVPMAQRPGELAGVEFYDAGIGFAVPRERLEEIVAALKTGQSFHRGWLGVSTDRRSRDGLIIRAVADPSPVRGAGIQPGDQIISANGQEIRNFGHLQQAIYMVPAGELVQLVVRRGELAAGYEVTLARSEELGPLDQESDADEDPWDLDGAKPAWP